MSLKHEYFELVKLLNKGNKQKDLQTDVYFFISEFANGSVAFYFDFLLKCCPSVHKLFPCMFLIKQWLVILSGELEEVKAASEEKG